MTDKLPIWRDRALKIEGGVLMLSRKGAHDDFEFFPDAPDGKEAAALVPGKGAKVLRVEAIAGNRLRLVSSQGNFVLTGDDWGGSARVTRE